MVNSFFIISRVIDVAKIRKNESKTKQSPLFFLPSASIFEFFTQSYEKTREMQKESLVFLFISE